MERRMILMDAKKTTALVAGATSGLGLAGAGALSDHGLNVARLVGVPAPGLTEVLREMAEQVRLLSATVDSLLAQMD
jgi:NAD(P)-dependent dehydrogenase (short-subunit alcohol dehydrogenase family)